MKNGAPFIKVNCNDRERLYCLKRRFLPPGADGLSPAYSRIVDMTEEGSE
jgi:hypothetical protein